MHEKKKRVYNFVHLHCYIKMDANSDAKVVDARSHQQLRERIN